MPENNAPTPDVAADAEAHRMFSADLVITATATVTHPDGADVPPPFPNPALTQE